MVNTDLGNKDLEKSIRRHRKRLKRQGKAIRKVDAKLTKWQQKMEAGQVCLAELELVKEKTEERLKELETMQAENT